MSLRGAIEAIRAAIKPMQRAAVCERCGSPPDAGRTVCVLLPGEVPGECPVCAHPVDHEGRAIGAPTPRGIYAAYLVTDATPVVPPSP